MAKKIKKDFDKEKMYQKIMPSILPQDKPAPSSQRETPAPSISSEAADDFISPHNFMENMVRDKLEHTMNVLGACDCPRCRGDITAIALNQLPTAYAVAEPGDEERFLKKLRGAYEVKATASLIKAIQQVKNNPRH